jgi:hypothetical protein
MPKPPKPKPNPNVPKVHPELQGFEISVNEFGEIVSTLDINKLNDFLDSQTEDKKFRGVEVTRTTRGKDAPAPPAAD